MGCAQSDKEFSPVEIGIINCEALLEYYDKSVLFLDSIHRNYASGGVILESQWNEVCKKGNLVLNNPLAKYEIILYFSLFKVSSTEFSLKKLLILAILLGQGNFEQKAKLLFLAEDDNKTGKLDIYKVNELISLMIDISIEFNTSLFIEEEMEGITEKKLKKYVAKLRKGVAKAKENFIETILDGCKAIDLDKFVKNMCFNQAHTLVTTHGIRLYVKEWAEKELLHT